MAARQDARGVVTTYGYDTLRRLVQITYNTVSGVTTAPAVSYSYDNVQTSNTKGLLLSMSVGTGYSESYSYSVGVGNGGNGGNKINLSSVTRAIDGRNYTTSFQYNTAGRFTQIVYPSARVINIGHDMKDRVTSVGTFLSSVSYDGIGRLSGYTLGNGVTEGYGYDTNRMELITQTATKSGGPQYGLLNLAYVYNAATGQMGVGSTAGNADQLMSISGTINSTTESVAYTYDNLKRLVTSNQTSNGSSVQRRFGFDQWGNRTGVWDAVSGGDQIQSISLQQSGGAPINRIATVTAGSTVTYYYDAAGNLTNDGVHTYGYDSENRIVSVDGGSAAVYAYDQSNQRYKKVAGGSTTHYIWQDDHVIAEYNGGSGALLAEYIYSGDRMVAKVESGATSYFLCDPLGARLTVDGGGNAVGSQGRLPFGEDFAETGTQEKHHFTTYERDAETGLDYAVNRTYSPSIGRFMENDPYKDGCNRQKFDPQKLNRYSYVENDPMNKVDPLGLMSLSRLVCIIAPILCEVNTLPGGGPSPNPDGYSGWHLGFGVGVPHTVPVGISQNCYKLKNLWNKDCNYVIVEGCDTKCHATEIAWDINELPEPWKGKRCPKYLLELRAWHRKDGKVQCPEKGVATPMDLPVCNDCRDAEM